jgi:hypothetical protein
MNVGECKNLIDGYLSWLRQGLQVEQVSERCCIIATPFLDRHNDEIEIYVERRGSGLWITDDGYTLADLDHGGVKLDTEKRSTHLKHILRGFGVKVEGSEICVETTERDFPQRKHNLIQAILAVNDMFVMGKESVLELFKEDVEKFLRLKGIPIFRDFKLSGKSGFDHKFDIGLPAINNHPEGVVQAINKLTKDRATSLAFMVADVELARGRNHLRAFAFINDEEDVPNSENLSALSAYNIQSFRWTKREESVLILAN